MADTDQRMNSLNKEDDGKRKRALAEEQDDVDMDAEQSDQEQDGDSIGNEEDDDRLGDSEEDSEEEEEDEEDERPSKQRSNKKVKRNQFIEVEAEVDESDDDDDFYDEGEDLDFIANEANEAEQLQPQIYRQLDRQREVQAGEDEDVEALTQRYKERYGRGAYRGPSAVFRGDSNYIPQQFLQPTQKDPKLWLVKCKYGRERDIAINLMRKAIAFEEKGHSLNIKSVVARDNLKGFLYVEARSMGDVQMAVDKMNNVYASKITLVPLNEMTQVLQPKKLKAELQLNSWVRVKRGKYKGDLAQVLDVAENYASLQIRLIPRLDLAAQTSSQDRRRGVGDDAKQKSRRQRISQRPAQRFFNVKDVSTNEHLDKRGGMYLFRGEQFDQNGFMIKTIKMNGVDTQNISPSLDEIAKFNSVLSDGEKIDLNTVNDNGAAGQQGDADRSEKSKKQSAEFVVGDLVYIAEGDLVNAKGVVTAVDKAQNLITLKMHNLNVGDVVIEPSKLIKTFHVGDHVQVVRGKYKDHSGMVTQVNGNIASIFSDLTKTQYEVFMKDLQSAVVDSIVGEKDSIYKVHDFVQLGISNVGVIVKVENGLFRVLDQNGILKTVKAQEITSKKDTKLATALDAQNNSLKVGNIVNVLSGEHGGMKATVLHVYRNWVFLLNNKQFHDTSGVFVVRSRVVQLLGRTNAGVYDNLQQPQMAPPTQMRPQARIGQGVPRETANLLHKTITITQGPYKGYQGSVKTVSEKGCRIELNSNGKVVNVPHTAVMLYGSLNKNGSMSQSQSSSGGDNFSRRAAGAQTPMGGSKTPNVYSGSQTPNVMSGADGMKTPAWDAAAKTPMVYSGMASQPQQLASGSQQDADFGRQFAATPKDYRNQVATPNIQRPVDDYTADQTTSSQNTINNYNNAADGYGNQQQTENGAYSYLEGAWLIENIIVTYNGAEGWIKSVIDGGQTGIFCDSQTEKDVQVNSSQVVPVPPVKKDLCVFVDSDLKGTKGTIMGFDDDEAIVSDDLDNWHMGSVKHLCKLKA
ncbi:hypothetical protein MP228_001673 [Amoeboaphelidium protococcarum]|nr:hypothetical protein MP228_001673 [Amoeboaphelidium protococcarum]